MAPGEPTAAGEPTAYARFIAGLPKAELHVHHVGSARPETVAALAARHPDAGVPQDLAALKDFFTFTDFAHFIDVYPATVAPLRTPEDIHLLTREVIEGLAAQRVRYAELTMTPFTSVRMGIPIEAYTEAIEDARITAERDTGTVVRWIYDIPGEAGLESADATISYAVDHGPASLVGFGLGGPENGVPRPQFRRTSTGPVPPVCTRSHSGESTGPETIWDAIRELGAERIGHGIAAIRGPTARRVPCGTPDPARDLADVEPATRVVERIEDHRSGPWRDAGVVVTVNSDDPPMFGTTLNRGVRDCRRPARPRRGRPAGVGDDSSGREFAPDDVKARIRREIGDHA